jgi:NAD(P)-dependent dehydrogenase (short-subunit alcohol dehydrogenase family)
MGVRSTTRGEAAANKLRAAANPSAKIDVWHLDMESYDSIQAFARNCADLATTTRIDMVILNAGLARLKFATTPSTKHEQTIQINHTSTLLLTILLLPVLSSSKHKHKLAAASAGGYTSSTSSQHQHQRPPVLTLVNSVTAHLAKFPNNAHAQRPLLPSFDDPTTYDAAERYGVSKLLNQLATVNLTELISPDDVVINMVDPGLTKGTGLARDAKGIYGVAVKLLLSIAGRPVNRGAATYVDAVLAHGKESHGCFLMNCKIAP